MARITRMGTGFVMVVSLLRCHPPGEHPLQRNLETDDGRVRVLKGS